jgi:hypothetical protein
MKTKTKLTLTGLLTTILVIGVMAWTSMTIVDPFTPGNAADEAAQAGTYMYAYKIPEEGEWSISIGGPYTYTAPDGFTITITITNNNGYTFDWSATSPIGAVIVKGGNWNEGQGKNQIVHRPANVFYYDPQAYSDTGLYAPLNGNTPDPDDTFFISHATFCWNPEVTEHRYETAFAYGGEYATPFIGYNNFHRWGWTNGISEGDYTFEVWAGAGQNDFTKGTLVGTVDIAYHSGVVTATFHLNSGVIFKQDSLGHDIIHIYADYGMFPLLSNNNPTVAPGQYYIATGLSGPIYVIVQAEVGIPI